ncbi:Protein of unknown function, DUF481 [Flexibacter flexilis DSM 6793]|uniref:DUF481 domain-containing protein n=2 Tax=Flexibacter flexilis TaxID=998 RepID=A0A1I1F8C1_9BACT|nr:Protein of unknown function, DUF481 [Flexibacter flexilis DSM 6793]
MALDSLVRLRADSLFRVWRDSVQQANTPKIQNTAPKTFKYSLALDGNFSEGNVQRILFITRAELSWKNKIMDITTHPRFVYGKQNGDLAERDGFTDLYVNVLHQKKVYGFGLGTAENSRLRDINSRIMGGAGIGFHLLRTDRNTFSVTNGIVYETTHFKERADVETFRNSLRIKGLHKIGSGKFRFKHLSFFQPSLQYAQNLRWSTQMSLEILLHKQLAFRTSFENYYESVIETGRQRNDLRWSVGLSFFSL